MKEIQISFNEEVFQRIKELSRFLDIDDFKVTNVSIIFELYKSLLPYQETLSKLPDMALHKSTDKLYEFKNELKDKLETDYDTIKSFIKIEDELPILVSLNKTSRIL